MRGDAGLKAVIPGGSSTPVLTPSELDVAMDFDSLKKYGSMLGSAAVIVFDETACLVRSLDRIAAFYEHESCGQCTPCREGTGWMRRIIRRIEKGGGKKGDLELLEEVAGSIMGRTICPLGDAAAMPVLAFISKFRGEFEEHISGGKCGFGPQPLAPVKTGRSWT
jgi:NADH-quinone oxidoreductase subunit F